MKHVSSEVIATAPARMFLLGVVGALSTWAPAQTAILVTTPYYEHFDSPVGSSGLDAGSMGTAWTLSTPAGSGEIDVLGGSLSSAVLVDASGNRAMLSAADTEEDGMNLKTSISAAGGPIYAGFLVEFTSLPSVGGDFFAHFTEGNAVGGTNFRGSVYARDNGLGAVELGIQAQSVDAVQYVTAKPLSLNTTYLVVERLDFGGGSNDDTASLFVAPSAGAEPSPDATAAAGLDFASIGRFALRQSSGIGTLELDELCLATSWDAVVNTSLAPISGSSQFLSTPPTFDGTLSGYGTGLAFQTVNTNFGTTSNQLNGLFIANDDTYLYLGTAGLITSNNLWWWFIDTPLDSSGVINLADPAGTLTNETKALGTNGGGTRLPDGFEADYAITWQYNTSGCINRPYLNNFTALTGVNRATCVTSGTPVYTSPWDAAFDYSLAGGGQTTAAGMQGTDAGVTAQSTTTGVEMRIPLSDLGLAAGDTIKIFAAVTGGGGAQVTFANQFLPGLPVGAGRVNGGGVSLANPPSLGGWGLRYLEVLLGTDIPVEVSSFSLE